MFVDVHKVLGIVIRYIEKHIINFNMFIIMVYTIKTLSCSYYIKLHVTENKTLHNV